jgi:hypothetical protein
MFEKHFYHSITRNLVLSFGELFNDIFVVRYDANRDEYTRIKVPIEYAPKNKWYRVLKQRDNEFKSVANHLPKLSFEFLPPVYDSNRNMQAVKPMVANGHRSLTPVTYNYDINLYFSVSNSDEGFQIFEQIAPMFKPSFNITATMIPELGFQEDIPITLKSIGKEDEFEGDFESLRFQTWTMTFEAEVNLWNRVTDSKLIKKAIVDLFPIGGSGKITPEEVSQALSKITITTEPDPLNADPEDDFGFTITIVEDI